LRGGIMVITTERLALGLATAFVSKWLE